MTDDHRQRDTSAFSDTKAEVEPWKIGEVGDGGGSALENMRQAFEIIGRFRARPPIVYHHSTCPKILTQGTKACRCGAAPVEALFEDERAGKL